MVTLLDLSGLIDGHIVVGVLLVPPALLKTATTGWRILRYYTHNPAYRRAGPPPMPLRILGPLVVLFTLAVLGSGLGRVFACSSERAVISADELPGEGAAGTGSTGGDDNARPGAVPARARRRAGAAQPVRAYMKRGLALIALGPSGSRTPVVTLLGFAVSALTVHKATFVAWAVVTGLHTLGRLLPAARIIGGGGRTPGNGVPGRGLRIAGYAGVAMLAGLTAILLFSASGQWRSDTGLVHHHHVVHQTG